MNEQLISFETAKLAKEKGFDIPCQWAFGKNGEEPINFNEYHYEFSKDNLIHGDNFNFYKGVYRNISAPTQSLLQKWLFETHKLYVEVRLTHGHDKVHFYPIIYDCNVHRPKEKSMYDLYNYNYIPEEAFEKGLQEALKLI